MPCLFLYHATLSRIQNFIPQQMIIEEVKVMKGPLAVDSTGEVRGAEKERGKQDCGDRGDRTFLFSV
jgi:hypothetical protein